jgi:predicted O-methyltransferase YrrM
MDPYLTWDRVQPYLEELIPPRHDELVRMERHAREQRFPIIGPACGHLCYQLARSIQAKRVFELGSGFGYSTAWFAKAVNENGGGEVHHVVWDQALSTAARTHLERMGLGHLVRYHVSEAIQALKASEGPFDLIFNDIDKEGYPDAMPAIEDKLRVGGILIVDNLLWHGRIFDDTDKEPSTTGVRALTRRVTKDPRWIASIIPIRDGMLVATRVG